MKQIKLITALTVFLLILAGCPVTDNQGNRGNFKPVLLISQNFENNTAGSYGIDDFAADWGEYIYPLGIEDGTVSIVNDSNPEYNKVMAVYFPAGSYNEVGNGKTQFKIEFNRSYENLYCSYNIKFQNSFDFVRGGKLPGLAGGTCNVGGDKPSGYDGFSTRMMWRDQNRLVSYVYHPDQVYSHGDDFPWGTVETGVWYHVEMHVRMNTPGEYDGVLEAWIDGRQVLDEHSLRFRDTGSIGIDTFYFSTFFGGSDSSWAASKDEYIYFDNFIVSNYPATH